MTPIFDLDQLVDRWRSPLVGLLAARGVSWARAEELAQDVFAEAWLGRKRFHADPQDERAVGAWLVGIARNLHRADARRLRSLAAEEDVVAGVAAPDGDLVDGTLVAEEEAERVRAAIAELPEREREVVQAFYLEETPTARVAALLETSERAVEGLLRRARARLKERLSASVQQR